MSNHRAKKSLGQNFLTSPSIAKDIVLKSGATRESVVLEIGPGTGMLTRCILDVGASVTAVEKDDMLYNTLLDTFSKEISSGQLTLIHGDILDFDTTSPRHKLAFSDYMILANIPYNITGAFFKKFLSTTHQPSSITVMIQKEVGERILAKPIKGKSRENILSLSIKAYGTPRIVKNVPKKHFLPQPKVDSVILHIDSISKRLFREIDEETFFKAIKSGFSHKRKKLIRNLAEVFPQEMLERAFKELFLDHNTRAEALTLDQWADLSRKLS